MSTIIDDHPLIDTLRDELSEIEDRVMKFDLADAIREGGKHAKQLHGGFRNGDRVCALSAALIACRARGL